MAGTTSTSRDSEAINVQLTPFNYTSTSIPLNQMGFYLKQGQYQLSSCLLNDGSSITDNQTVFNIQIQYEKSVGKFRINTNLWCWSRTTYSSIETSFCSDWNEDSSAN